MATCRNYIKTLHRIWLPSVVHNAVTFGTYMHAPALPSWACTSPPPFNMFALSLPLYHLSPCWSLQHAIPPKTVDISHPNPHPPIQNTPGTWSNWYDARTTPPPPQCPRASRHVKQTPHSRGEPSALKLWFRDLRSERGLSPMFLCAAPGFVGSGCGWDGVCVRKRCGFESRCIHMIFWFLGDWWVRREIEVGSVCVECGFVGWVHELFLQRLARRERGPCYLCEAVLPSRCYIVRRDVCLLRTASSFYFATPMRTCSTNGCPTSHWQPTAVGGRPGVQTGSQYHSLTKNVSTAAPPNFAMPADKRPSLM